MVFEFGITLKFQKFSMKTNSFAQPLSQWKLEMNTWGAWSGWETIQKPYKLHDFISKKQKI
jgi:hypothetical protein